jgi:hypothetical protein
VLFHKKNLGLMTNPDLIILGLIVKSNPIVLILTAKKLLGLTGQLDPSFHPRTVRSGWATEPNAIGAC